MRSPFPIQLQERMKGLERASLRRRLIRRQGIDFSSNDYLGFSRDATLLAQSMERFDSTEKFLGSTGSRLLRGNLALFEDVEQDLADFCGSESALLFSSGYQANLGLLSGLLNADDVIFSDQYNHASIIDGVRLSGARKRIYPHLNLQVLRQLLERDKAEASSRGYLRVIVTESVFSMDGDLAPLLKLAEIADEFSALLIVDEAHATGLWGDFSQNRGGGWVQALGLSERVFATVHPAGKAMGVGGAWICGSAQLKNYLVNHSRAFIFSTAPLPILGVFLKASVAYWKQVGVARARVVLDRSHYLQTCLGGVQVPGPIVPFQVGANDCSVRLAQRLQESGFDVRAIRPPTVPVGTSRLRLTVSSDHSPKEIESLVREIRRGEGDFVSLGGKGMEIQR